MRCIDCVAPTDRELSLSDDGVGEVLSLTRASLTLSPSISDLIRFCIRCHIAELLLYIVYIHCLVMLVLPALHIIVETGMYR